MLFQKVVFDLNETSQVYSNSYTTNMEQKYIPIIIINKVLIICQQS